MPFMPFNILGMWFRGMLSFAILAGGIYLLIRWYDHSHVIEKILLSAPPGETADILLSENQQTASTPVIVPGRRIFRFDPGWNRPTGELAAAVALLLWATVGQWIAHVLSMLSLRPGSNSTLKLSAGRPVTTNPVRESKKTRRMKARRQKKVVATRLNPEGDEDPQGDRTGEVHTIKRPDGSELRVECYGPKDAPPIVWSHGWGANSTEWFYQKRYLSNRFRLIIWDEPGLGLSKKPNNNDYRLKNMAADLDAVMTFAGKHPAVLVGHSIGGMITLTYCKEFPEALATRVAGLVLVHTSYTNPVRTTQMATLYTALEKPVLIPLMYLTIALWPLAWLMNWMSYFNGSAQRSTHKSSFSGNETRGQLAFAAKFMPQGRPDVLARGMLGMIAYDATDVLAQINVPTLVVVGDLDTTTLPEAGAFIAKHIARAELVTLTPAKHMGLIEHHERFDSLVADFAGKCQPVAGKRQPVTGRG
jgi:pimeloyl-ACP methyl ester carboxylesterase